MIVDTLAALNLVRERIAKHKIVGIDLENNHNNSYNGFTCLIQLSVYDQASGDISTFVIDVLVPEISLTLRDALGASLFENPSVLKLMHGCLTSDLEWMVRDYGIKVVNVYDT